MLVPPTAIVGAFAARAVGYEGSYADVLRKCMVPWLMVTVLSVLMIVYKKPDISGVRGRENMNLIMIIYRIISACIGLAVLRMLAPGTVQSSLVSTVMLPFLPAR